MTHTHDNDALASMLMEIHRATITERYYEDVRQDIHTFDVTDAATVVATYRDSLEREYLAMLFRNDQDEYFAEDRWSSGGDAR